MSKTIIFLLFVTFMTGAEAQEKFISKCKKSLKEDRATQDEIAWLKFFFETPSCSKIASKISTFKSFNRFLPRQRNYQRFYTFWSEELPDSFGVARTGALKDMPWAEIGVSDEKNVASRLELYEEFKNLDTLEWSSQYNYTRGIKICDVVRRFPQIKTILLDGQDLVDLANCPESAPDIIVQDLFNGSADEQLAHKIIAFRNYYGKIDDLQLYSRLRHLGLEQSTNEHGISALAQNVNLTYLRLDTNKPVLNVSELRNLKNLRYLKITCESDAWVDVGPTNSHFKTCDEPYLNDLSFLPELKWLVHLDLRNNKIKDASFLTYMKRLQHIDLSNNDIEVVPDLSHLKDLRYVNFENNPSKRSREKK